MSNFDFPAIIDGFFCGSIHVLELILYYNTHTHTHRTMDLNMTTVVPDMGSGSGSGLMSNMTPEEFSCLNTDMLSGTMVTNETVWTILPELHYGTPYVATVVFIFFVVSFLWNLFIIVTYFVKYWLLKEPGNIFLLSLAFFDIFLTVSMTLLSFITEVRRAYIFGNDDITRCRVCDMLGFFFVFLVSGSLHLLAALSVDRFIHLARPLRYNKIMKRWIAVLMVVLITILSFIIAILPIAAGFGQYEFNIRFGACLPRLTGTSRAGISNLFFFTFIIAEALIPIFILAVTNVFTFRIIRKFLRRNLRRRSTYRKREDLTGDQRKHQQQQNQLVKVFGALFIANVITWSLIIVIIFVVNGVSATLVPDELYIFGWLCYLTNPLFHPIIESFFVKDLRLVVHKAKKEVRRASTFFVRQSSKLLTGRSSALDEANARIDREENATPNSHRRNESLATEAYEMSVADTPPPSRSPDGGRRSQSLKKVGRSVTFSEEVNGPTLPSPNSHPSKPGSAMKKNKLTHQTNTDVIVEEDDIFGGSDIGDAENVTDDSPATLDTESTAQKVAESELSDENGLASSNSHTEV